MSVNYAIKIHAHGGPEQFRVEDVPIPEPGQGQVLVRNTAIGLNFIDVYHRTGLYPVPLPAVPGLEGAGVVEALGPGVSGFSPGDRVAYTNPIGAYAHYLLRPVERLVRIPAAIPDELAAASMLKGLTAHYLLFSTYVLQAGDSIVVHAAAGGVGQILCRWARARGATVIGTVGSDAKRNTALGAGCQHVLLTDQPIAPAVRELTAGRGVPVVYDGIGQATFTDSLDCLQPRGLMVSYGNASGPVKGFDLGMLAARGSLFITRPSLMDYIAGGEELQQRASDLFKALAGGEISVDIHQRYPLREVAQAHRDLEARKTRGSVVLTP